MGERREEVGLSLIIPLSCFILYIVHPRRAFVLPAGKSALR